MTVHTDEALAGSATPRRDAGQFDRGDVSFVIMSGALVSLMIPGLAFLYAGLVRRKSALSLIWAVCACNAVVIFQWFLCGYSLAFSSTAANGFIGNLRNFGLRNILGDPSPGSPLISELLYSFFQMEFACVTAGILIGAIAERGRVFPAMIFTFVWMTIVYCPLAYWVWGTNGWGLKWGVLDFSGGGPVEIGSGIGGLAYAWVLGPRREKELVNFRPHNVSMVALGTFLLWFGWLGFNGGSAFGANLRAIMTVWNSMLSGAFGGITWCLLDYPITRKWSVVSFCSGTIAGLVSATAASGFVPPWASVVTGIAAGFICKFATKLKFKLGIDDTLDIAAQHAVGGIVGLLANAFFATNAVIKLDGVNYNVRGGFLDRNWKQLYIQGLYISAAVSYTFVATAVIAVLFNCLPGLDLRSTEEGEARGMDDTEIGEFASDYVEVRREYTDWVDASTKSTNTTADMLLVTDDPHKRPAIPPRSLKRKEHQARYGTPPQEIRLSFIGNHDMERF